MQEVREPLNATLPAKPKIEGEVSNPPELSHETPIPKESLLPLIEAEFAIRNGDYENGLGILSNQARYLTDPGLARRALRLAEYLKEQDIATQMAVRLSTLDPSDGLAAAAASRLLARSGNTLLSLDYAYKALSLGADVNVAANIAKYEKLDLVTRQRVSETVNKLWSQWSANNHLIIATSLLSRFQGDWKLAEERLKPLLKSSPIDVRALMLWTQIQLDQEKENPYDLLKKAVQQHPLNEELRFKYAQLLAADERLSEAKSEFSILISANPESPELLLTAALLNYELGLLDEALSLLNRLLETRQRDNEAYYYLGLVETSLDNAEAAIASYAAVEPSAQFQDSKMRAAKLLTRYETSAEVNEFFLTQRLRHPRAAEQLFLLEAEAVSNWPGASLEIYNSGLQVFPKSFSLLYGRAMAHEELGSLKNMEADLRAILRVDPNHTATLNALGYTLTNNTLRFKEAEELIKRALLMSPSDPAILDSLGWVHFKMGEYASSEDLLRKAYSALPDPEVAAHLGELLWTQGRKIEAIDIWKIGLSQGPTHPIILETLRRLGAKIP